MILTRTLTAVLAMALLAGCAPSPIKHTEGTSAVTQINMWSYKGKLETTNYAVDTFIPVNSQVEILDTSGKAIAFRVQETGQQVTLVNIAKYTKLSIDEIYDRYFGSQPVSLSEFSKLERDAIEEGGIAEGMSKEAVLVARGYPPAHETPSLDRDSWRFWQSRFDTIEVRFEDGKVSDIIE